LTQSSHPMVAEVQKTVGAESWVGTVALVYVFIDSMAWTGLPTKQQEVTGRDFIDWVNRYMVVPGEVAEYHYKGEDLYAARCGFLHTYSMKTSATGKRFGYHDGTPHRYRPDIDASLVVLSVPLLVDDLWAAVARYVAEVRRRGDAGVVEERMDQMLQTLPFKAAR
jgi:hypothetical protein